MAAEHDPIQAYLDVELTRLRTEWLTLTGDQEPLFSFSWENLKEALLEDAASPAQEMLIRGALAAVVKQAKFKPPNAVLKDVVVLVGGLERLRDDFSTPCSEDEME